ncbi:hypothetical protein PR048_022909 [Dryococelus australis]|uniref:Uncharacterized protein n=1 Tax=Dryococelus australis TaxID=614101 RepID=A0ABQ9GSP0_9NEOP|nr:hypothetical protein PR048_022909 [Dryococelus australis]
MYPEGTAGANCVSGLTPYAYKGRKLCKETCIAAERDWAAMASDWGHDYLPKRAVKKNEWAMSLSWKYGVTPASVWSGFGKPRTPENASFLHWLLPVCEVTPFLSNLHVIGAHDREVFIYWRRVTRGVGVELIWDALNIEVLRADEGETRQRPFTIKGFQKCSLYREHPISADQRRNATAVKMGDPRENPVASGTARHDSHVRKLGNDSSGNLTRRQSSQLIFSLCVEKPFADQRLATLLANRQSSQCGIAHQTRSSFPDTRAPNQRVRNRHAVSSLSSRMSAARARSLTVKLKQVEGDKEATVTIPNPLKGTCFIVNPFVRYRIVDFGQYHLGTPLVDDRPVMNALKYRVVSSAVWTNRTVVSSNTATNRTGVLAVVDAAIMSKTRRASREDSNGAAPSDRVFQFSSDSRRARLGESCPAWAYHLSKNISRAARASSVPWFPSLHRRASRRAFPYTASPTFPPSKLRNVPPPPSLLVFSLPTNKEHGSYLSGATVTERLACSFPTKAIRAQSPAGSLRIFACGNRAGRCRWSAGFLGDLLYSPPLHSGAASYSPESPTSALKTSMLRAAQISTFIHSILPICYL